MTEQPRTVAEKRRRMESGFATLREALSYLMGAVILGYGVLEAPTDRQLVVIGAGMALIGAPLVGGVFDKKV